jgi:hypothetical protein
MREYRLVYIHPVQPLRWQVQPTQNCYIARCNPSFWKKQRHDVVMLPSMDPNERCYFGELRSIFSIKYKGDTYQLVLLKWFDRVKEPLDATGMIRLVYSGRPLECVGINTIGRPIHIIPYFKKGRDQRGNWKMVYVNHFIDRHAYEVID